MLVSHPEIPKSRVVVKAESVMRVIGCLSDNRISVARNLKPLSTFVKVKSKFRAPTMRAHLEKTFSKASPMVIPRIEHFLFADETDLRDDEDDFLWEALALSHKAGLPSVDELAELVALLASLRFDNVREARNSLRPLVNALGAGTIEAQWSAYATTGELLGTQSTLLHRASLVSRQPPHLLLEALSDAVPVATKLLASACVKTVRQRLFKNLAETKSSSVGGSLATVANVIEKMRFHAALGDSGLALMNFVDPSPHDDEEEGLQHRGRNRSRQRARDMIDKAREEWQAVEKEGVESLLELRHKFRDFKGYWKGALKVSSVHFETEQREKVTLDIEKREHLALVENFGKVAADHNVPNFVRHRSRKKNDERGSLAHATVNVSHIPRPLDASRKIFVENLPRDSSEDTLVKAFRRCGPVESVKLYHNENNAVHEDDRKKKLRGQRHGDDVEDRSPTCAFVDFEDVEGALKAMHPILKVFGVVIDGRNCVTSPVSDANSIYLHHLDTSLENEPIIEAKLSEILENPVTVFRKYEESLPPSRVRLQFEHHLAAQWAWDKLQAHRESHLRQESERKEPLPPYDLSWSSVPPNSP